METEVSDKLLLEFMTDSERAAYYAAQRGGPYRSVSSIFWRYCSRAQKQKVLNRIRNDPQQHGKLVARLVADAVWGK